MQESEIRYAGVVLNLPLNTVFTYEIPPALMTGHVVPGSRVLVPFRNKQLEGYVVELSAIRPEGVSRIKKILGLLDQRPLISADLLALGKWMSSFYCSTLGETLEAIGPPRKVALKETYACRLLISTTEAKELAEKSGTRAPRQMKILEYLSTHNRLIPHSELVKECGADLATLRRLAGKGYISLSSSESEFLSLTTKTDSIKLPELTPSQQKAIDAVVESSMAQDFKTFLLHGVTGSGKTEVYLRIISYIVAHGGKAIVLVPEISLTPQTVGRFRERFPKLAVLHSAMAAGTRRKQWELAYQGKIDVVIGARSAVFAPIPNLKLIVVDEEHEPSYKQENSPRYHAREVAIMRAKQENATVLLGSATPSLESYNNAITGKFEHLELPERVPGANLPEVEIVDMKEEQRAMNKSILLSRKLSRRIAESLERKEQVLLFLNRRGFNVFGRCSNCFSVLTCPHCDITLTYHKARNVVACHFCGWKSEAIIECPHCNHPAVNYIGSGTERVEDVLAKLFPEARIARMDADTTTKRDSHKRILDSFRDGEFDILVGTQMIAKGLDYPRISTVGVIDADVSLAFPDFRAQERTFQLLSQVAGRSGRGTLPGCVIIQTTRPDVPAIQMAAQHDFVSFANLELEERKALNYPPFGKICRVIAKSKNPQHAFSFLSELRDGLTEVSNQYGARILGPTQAPISKTEDHYRYHMLLRAPNHRAVAAITQVLREKCEPPSDVLAAIDIHPYSML